VDDCNRTKLIMASNNQDLEAVAETFDRETDPLRQYEKKFSDVDVNIFEAYVERVLLSKDPSNSTLKNYRHSFGQWEDFMSKEGRHPACPNEEHIKRFPDYLATVRGNSVSTIRRKIDNLNRIYEWWQDHHAFPHPTDYNPFSIAKREMDLSEDSEEKQYPYLTESDLSEIIRNCTNIRERLFLIWLLKLGMRVGEFRNIKLKDISIAHANLKDSYPTLGTASEISDYENCIFVPSKYDQDGNKSSKPRILPLDDELRHILLQYLMTRPKVDEPWLILSQRTHKKMTQGDPINTVWKAHFHEYNQAEEYREVTTHYGRHYFTRYWKIQEEIQRELVQYMRGDELGDTRSGDSIDDYLAAYYEDIKTIYLDRVPKFL